MPEPSKDTEKSRDGECDPGPAAHRSVEAECPMNPGADARSGSRAPYWVDVCTNSSEPCGLRRLPVASDDVGANTGATDGREMSLGTRLPALTSLLPRGVR